MQDINSPTIQDRLEKEMLLIQNELMELRNAKGFDTYVKQLESSMDSIKDVIMTAKDMEDVKFLQAVHAGMKRMLDVLPYADSLSGDDSTIDLGENDDRI